MAIEITGNKLSFDGVEFKQGDVTASKDFELKRKSDTGIPIKRLRAFESSSTFIDMNRAAGRQRNKFGSKLNKGETLDVFVKDTYEAFHIDPFLISIGPKANIPIELTGSISTQTDGVTQTSAFLNGFTGFDQDNYGFILDNGLITTGIITADNALSVAPGTSLIYGALGTIGGSGNAAETSQDIVIQPNTTTTINVSDENPSYTIAAGINYTISVGADVTIVSSNQTFTGGDIGDTGVEILDEEVVVGPDTTVGTGGVAFTQIISTNTIAGAGTTTLNVTDENLSITINEGIEYTIPAGSNVTIINANQTFTGGTIGETGVQINEEEVVVSPDTTVGTGGVSFTQIISTHTVAGAGATTLNVTDENLSITINDDINYTIPTGSNVTIINSNQQFTGGTVTDITVTGDTLVEGEIAVGWDNDIPITASLTLSNAVHGMGRQVLVKSGSNPLYGVDIATSMEPDHPLYGLPSNAGQYRATSPAGAITLELPSASVGMSFDIISKQSYSGTNPNPNTLMAPTILVTPNDSEKFIFNIAGASGTIGKGIQLVSQSMQPGARLHVTCQNEASWSVIQMNGPWTDEA